MTKGRQGQSEIGSTARFTPHQLFVENTIADVGSARFDKSGTEHRHGVRRQTIQRKGFEELAYEHPFGAALIPRQQAIEYPLGLIEVSRCPEVIYGRDEIAACFGKLSCFQV